MPPTEPTDINALRSVRPAWQTGKEFKMLTQRSSLLAAVLATAIICTARGQVSPAPGYITAFTNTAARSGLEFLPDAGGNWLTMTANQVIQYTPTGQFVASHYNDLDPTAFGSFVVADPTGTYALAGQTSSEPGFPGTIHAFRLDGSLAGTFDMPGNFDAAFDPITTTLVISALNGLPTNALWAVDADPASSGFGQPIQIGSIGGNSGPLAFDQAGNLFVGTSGVDLDGDGVGSFDAGIVAFNADQVAAALAQPDPMALSNQNWNVILPDAASQNVGSLTVDADGDLIYHDFTNLIQLQIEITGSGPSATISAVGSAMVATGPSFALSAIDFLPSPPGSFEPGPAVGLGGTVGVAFDSNGDFATDSMVGITPLPEPASAILILAAAATLATRKDYV